MNKGLILGLALVALFNVNVFAEDKIDTLRMELAQESKELRELVSSFTDKLESVKEPFRNEINKVESKVDLKNKELKELNVQLKALKKQLAEKEDLLTKMTDTLARCEASLTAVRSELSMANKTTKSLSTEKVELAKKESDARLLIEQLNKEKNNLAEQNENVLAKAAQKSDLEKAKLSSQINKLSREIAIFQEKINEHLAVRVSLNRDIELANARLTEANNQIAVQDSDLKKADKKIAALNSTITRFEEKIADNEVQCKEKESEIRSLSVQIDAKDEVLAKNSKSIKEFDKMVKNLESTVAEKDRTIKLKDKEKEDLVAYFKGELDNRKKQIIQLLKQTK